jgi:N-methylhydantoinase B
VLEDATFMSIADRSILACWGVNGGKAGLPFCVTIDPGGAAERVLPGLCDAAPIAAGEVVRIETTGGGGWGDPLDRDPDRVALDVLQGKVSAEAALGEYGVVLGDAAATERTRSGLRAERGAAPFFDRGPGYERLAGAESSRATAARVSSTSANSPSRLASDA